MPTYNKGSHTSLGPRKVLLDFLEPEDFFVLRVSIINSD